MATLVLTFVGGYVGGPAGAALGSALGGAIDAKYTYPALFPPKSVHLGKVKDFEFQSGSEGTPINKCFGPSNRVTGTIIWMPTVGFPLQEKKRDSGKGGASYRYRYYNHVAVGICLGPIVKIRTIWADGTKVFDDRPNVSVTSNQISGKKVERINYSDGSSNNTFEFNGVQIIAKAIFHVTFPISILNIGSFNEIEFSSGGANAVTLSGFNDSRNNGAFYLNNIIDNADGTVTLELLGDLDPSNKIRIFNNNRPQTEAAGANVTMSQPVSLFDKKFAKNIDVTHLGTETQSVDPLIESIMGVGNAPAFRGLAYVVFEKIRLDRWGNRIPNFAFLVEAQTTKTVASTISDIVLSSGLTASDVDVTSISSVGDVRGYTLPGPYTPKLALEPLMIAHNLLAQESNGKLRFFSRGSQTVKVITTSDLAAHELGGTTERPFNIENVDEQELPSMVTIDYIDHFNNQKGSQSERKQLARANVKAISLDMVLLGQDAKSIAGRILWNAWRNQQRISLSLPPRYIDIEEGDIIQATGFGQVFKILVDEVTIGNNYLVEIIGSVEDISDFVTLADTPTIADQKIGVPSSVTLELLDIGPLRDSEVEIAGVYLFVANTDYAAKWQGAAIYSGPSVDALDYVQDITEEAIIGSSTIQTTQTELIIDNEDSGATREGKWNLFTDTTTGKPINGSFRLREFAFLATDRFTWNFTVPSTGEYDVFVTFPAGANRTKVAEYKIVHDAGSAYVTLDQTNTNLWDQWILLGRFTFTNVNRSVVLTAGNDGGVTCADAIRVFKVDTSNRLPGGSVGYYDRASSVTVEIINGTLESKSDAQVTGGENWAYLGGEIIAFKTATLVGTRKYTLTNLLRGLRDTSLMMGKHVAGEVFIMLDKAELNFVPIDTGKIGIPTLLKAVSPGEIVDNISSDQYVLRGTTRRPFSPARFIADYESFGTFKTGIKLSWFYRTRATSRVLNTAVWGKFGVDPEGFILKIYNSKGLLKRTVETLGSSYVYEGTDQNVDQISSNELLTFAVAQKSSLYGQGNSAIITKNASV